MRTFALHQSPLFWVICLPACWPFQSVYQARCHSSAPFMAEAWRRVTGTSRPALYDVPFLIPQRHIKSPGVPNPKSPWILRTAGPPETDHPSEEASYPDGKAAPWSSCNHFLRPAWHLKQWGMFLVGEPLTARMKTMISWPHPEGFSEIMLPAFCSHSI